MSEAADVPAVVRVAQVADASVERRIGDDTLAPDWERRPAPRSRPARGEMSDDLLAPEPLRLPRRRRLHRGPLGDELIEPDWAALSPRGHLLGRRLGPLGDDPMPPDWTWTVSRDAAVLRLGYRPLGDDVMRADWTVVPSRVLRLGHGPLGDDVLTPDDSAGAERLEASRGRRDAAGSIERASGRALERPADQSLEEHRDVLPLR